MGLTSVRGASGGCGGGRLVGFVTCSRGGSGSLSVRGGGRRWSYCVSRLTSLISGCAGRSVRDNNYILLRAGSRMKSGNGQNEKDLYRIRARERRSMDALTLGKKWRPSRLGSRVHRF